MKSLRITTTSTTHSEMNFDDLFSEITRDWQHKAVALQARRWRSINNS